MLSGTWTLEEYSRRVDDLDLWPAEPAMEASTDYRRWAFESAALDLALRQAEHVARRSGRRAYRPVRFVASTRAQIEPYLALNPALEFKLDVEKDWDRALMDRLAATERVRVVDIRRTTAARRWISRPIPSSTERRQGVLPDAVIEDAWLEDGCREALVGREERLSFDAPIHSWSDVGSVPKRDGLMLSQRGSSGSAPTSLHEWIGASKLSRSSAPASASRQPSSSHASSITASGNASATSR